MYFMPLTLENVNVFFKIWAFLFTAEIKQYKEGLVVLKGVDPDELFEHQRVNHVLTF